MDAQDPLIDLAAALVDAARAGDSRRLSRAALHTRAAIEHLHLAAESLAEVTS